MGFNKERTAASWKNSDAEFSAIASAEPRDIKCKNNVHNRVLLDVPVLEYGPTYDYRELPKW